MNMLAKWFMMVLLLIGSNAAHADEAWVEVSPSDSGVPLENPGMGWVFHHYDNGITGYGAPLGDSYNGSEFPGLTVCYLRLSWGYVEPVEGEFNWSILDTPIQRYVAAGKKFAFRFTTLESDNPIRATPEWVQKAGAKGKFVTVYKRQSWEPDYDDPIYLAKLEKFLNAVGKRYASNPNLVFVDVGTLGLWGEGHPIARRYGLSTLRRHIELHQKAFENTQIVGLDDWNTWFNEKGKPSAMEMARSMGLAFRDDTLCVYKDPQRAYSAHLAQPFVADTPVMLEMGHYGNAKQRKAWSGGKRYLQAVKDYRASYVSVHANPILFLKENNDIVNQINMTLGYRLNLEKAAWSTTVKLAEGLTITSQWRNVGVAPCLPGGHVGWSLFDSNNALAAVLVDTNQNMRAVASDPEKMAVPTSWKQHFSLPLTMKPGTYTVAVSVGGPSGTPKIALPLKGQVGKTCRYALGTLLVE
jgi:hypothetical protein